MMSCRRGGERFFNVWLPLSCVYCRDLKKDTSENDLPLSWLRDRLHCVHIGFCQVMNAVDYAGNGSVGLYQMALN